jgi:hypothetical protein
VRVRDLEGSGRDIPILQQDGAATYFRSGELEMRDTDSLVCEAGFQCRCRMKTLDECSRYVGNT